MYLLYCTQGLLSIHALTYCFSRRSEFANKPRDHIKSVGLLEAFMTKAQRLSPSLKFKLEKDPQKMFLRMSVLFPNSPHNLSCGFNVVGMDSAFMDHVRHPAFIVYEQNNPALLSV
jgi:hypothetical protein